MENNWASENLQLIRTLMERSALYRRALAPVMIVSGSIGLVAAFISCFVKMESTRVFSVFWMGVSLLAGVAAFLLVRRQALKEAEPFWSLPTRRVTQALLPAFFVGLVAALAGYQDESSSVAWLLALTWIIAYGCALHAAGFFMKRGIKLFGWIFITGGCGLLLAAPAWPQLRTVEGAHYLMGVFFGLLHVGCGIYLCFTEKRKTAT
jgi:hypothetical protein